MDDGEERAMLGVWEERSSKREGNLRQGQKLLEPPSLTVTLWHGGHHSYACVDSRHG